MTGSTIPLLVLLLPHAWALGVVAALSGGALLAEGTRFAMPTFNRWVLRWFGVFFKPEERHARITGATYLVLAALVCLLAFPQDIAALALFFLSLGDPVAAIVGEQIAAGRVFGKSPLGSGAFFLVAVAIAALVALRPELSFDWRLLVGAAVAAAMELLPFPLDDNATVPLVSGAVLTALI